MKIFFTTSDALGEELDQVCPFGEQHEFTNNNGEKFYLPKKVGCGGCFNCKYCYGGDNRDYNYGLLPNSKSSKHVFMQVPLRYVKCSKCYNEEYNKKIKMRFQLWFYHKIRRRLSDFFDDLKFSLHLKYRILKSKFNKNG